VLRVRAPWVRHHVESHGVDASRPAYIIPNTDTVVLGGTKEPGNEDRTSTREERQEIFDRCKQIVPSLEAAEVVGHWVGLRPGREGIRLEIEEARGRTIIHNYGHGGSGLTLAYGCAGDVVDLVRQVL
jgi:glycine/D-amino acid oxidase-like deaminating enzyme